MPDPSNAFALSRLDDPGMAHVPMGIFRSVERPTYDDLVRSQVAHAVADAGGDGTAGTSGSDADLARLLHGKDTWTVGA